MNKVSVLYLGLAISLAACNDKTKEKSNQNVAQEKKSCCEKLPNRFGGEKKGSPEGMVWIEGGTFMMGADNDQARDDEYPKHEVRVSGFYMDVHEVTNAQFRKFVEATGYITEAERKPDWEEIKKQLPPGTPKPDESVLVAASLTFTPPNHPVSLNNPGAWWTWTSGASWKHPQGPDSSIDGKDNYPVVHVSWNDAMAYCKWAGKRLPTEAEWEFAARGGLLDNIYPWGNENVEEGKMKANFWQGQFPSQNLQADGFYTSGPVKTFDPNGYGLFDMAGNVWEWCSDNYHHDYYKRLKGLQDNPKGPEDSYDPNEPGLLKKVTRGGSFLCNEAYCSGYRVAARMKSTPDTALEHTGFRCVKDK